MSFTLKQVRYFMAVAELGSVSSAAIEVCISASSITAAIQDLEKELGVSLFSRHRKGLKLTYDGHRFVQHSQNILNAVSNAQYALDSHQELVEGKLSIGVTYTIASYFLVPLIGRFKRSFPNLDITISEHKRSIVEKKLINGSLDIALVITSNLINNSDITSETLIQSSRRLWVPPNHPFIKLDSVSLEDVSHEPYIQLTIDEARVTHPKFWGQLNLRPKTTFKTNSIEAMRSLVATGEGITILSDVVYRPWSLEGDRIITIDLSDPIPSMDIGLAWKKSQNKANAKTFIDYCRMEYTSGRNNYRGDILSL